MPTLAASCSMRRRERSSRRVGSIRSRTTSATAICLRSTPSVALSRRVFEGVPGSSRLRQAWELRVGLLITFGVVANGGSAASADRVA